MLNRSFFCRFFIVALALAAFSCATGCDSLPVSANPGDSLVISEVVTSNSASLSQEELGSPDWIELHNLSNDEIDLSGYGLSDNLKDPHKWIFPSGVKLAAGDYIIVYAARYAGSNEQLLCAGFGLSKSGETLYLTDAYYNVLQQLKIPALLSDVSYARDTSGEYGYCASPTPGVANGEIVFSSAAEALTSSASRDLTITECMPRGGALLASDGRAYPWAELYNSGSTAILLSDYYLSDTMHEPLKWRLPGSTLAPGEYAIVWFSGEDSAEGLHAPFRLGKQDEVVCLSDGSGELVSMLNWPAEKISEGICVLPGNVYTAHATPGAANDTAVPFTSLDFSAMDDAAPVRLNELLLHNAYSLRDDTGERNPWVELYNHTGETVSLWGYYLSDDLESPFKWAFPADAQIGPGEYLIVFLSGKGADMATLQAEAVNESGGTSGALHTAFRLSDSDEALILTNVMNMNQERWDLPGDLGENVSMGPADQGGMSYFTSPTPGTANTTHAFAEPLNHGYTDMGGIYISEVSATSAAKSGALDWIEIHNASDQDVDLAGWQITDDIDFPEKCILESLAIPAGGYGVITASSSAADGAKASFGISLSGETLMLRDTGGNIRDIFHTGALRVGVTLSLIHISAPPERYSH